MEYFEIKSYEVLCSVKDRLEFYMIDFEEKNEIPNGYPATEYESKGFSSSREIKDFPIRSRGVTLRIKKRRWRHKKTGEIIMRDFSFIAEGSKFTKELSDFLKSLH